MKKPMLYHGDRRDEILSHTVRTYNYHRGTVKDARSNKIYDLSHVLDGELQPIIEDVAVAMSSPLTPDTPTRP